MNEVSLSQHEEAILLHNSILEKGAAAANALADFCSLLKEMRDSGLYRELGCAEFEDYCINLAGIKARMAYNYIAAYERLGDEYIREYASLGITKLEVLSRMNEEDRAELIESADEKSVSELKRLQEELSVSGRQVDMLTEELDTKQDELNELEKMRNGLSDELEAAKDDIKELSEKLEAAEKELEDRAEGISEEERAALEKEITDKVSEANDKKIKAEAKKIADEKVKKTTEKISAERDEAVSRAETIRAEKEAAEQRIAELERKLRNSDTVIVTAKAYLSAVQDNFSKLAALITSAEGETGEKLKSAAVTVLDKCREVIG